MASTSLLTRSGGVASFCGRELPPGPGHDEPDHVEFRSPDGLPCILHRNGLGAWCGYVGVQSGHPWYGKMYDDINDPWPEVHGGLTYSERCQGEICHVARPGESDDVWWLGFDCIHSGDRSLSDVFFGLERPDLFCHRNGGEYRTVEYAMSKTLGLARQASAAGGEVVIATLVQP